MNDRSMRRQLSVATILVLIGSLLGCSGSSPPADQGDVKVTAVTLGRTVGPDGTIAADARTNSFWISDTFYLSVETEGTAPSVALKARWTSSDGTVVGESTKTISPKGAMTTAFEASKEGGWPPGDYKVEVFLNDVSVATKDLAARG